eukprot:TRINITY_DN63261_c0_g1_i1.p1 TRINITY_DN63261_c0_g1~~TRINITY_DN63261_c0_g1_i1.p1  ORF type:complete len:405 (+),score=64.52 TRINITY_DN63261_c0_g1_i1:132-1346(+)
MPIATQFSIFLIPMKPCLAGATSADAVHTPQHRTATPPVSKWSTRSLPPAVTAGHTSVSAAAGLAAAVAAGLWSSETKRRLRICGQKPRGGHRRRRLTRFASPDGIPEAYSKVVLHKELFDANTVDDWILPEAQEAFREWHDSKKDFSKIDLERLPDVRVEAPGVLSFGLLKPEICQRILEESKHFRACGLPVAAPNSMNRDGVSLNEIGLRPSFTRLFQRYLRGIAARAFGDDQMRAEAVGGSSLGTDDWGGSTVGNHHTFMVRYRPESDSSLDMHVDDCEVSFTIGLTDDSEYDGGELTFCGMYGQGNLRQEHASWRQGAAGRCVVFAGKRRHGVTPVTRGERAALVVWTHSLLFRMTDTYKQKCGDFINGIQRLPEDDESPDAVCLSLQHDQDYLYWSERV